jgi:AcrR family transcriptional regulator
VDLIETPRRKDWHATRELILETFARMSVEEGVRDVSIQQVADRAGIAHRTVYRHFPNRQALIDELAEWLFERGIEHGQVQEIDSLDELAEAIIINARTFDQDAEMMKALVLATWESGQIADGQRQRTEDLNEALEPLTADLDPAHARAVQALIRYLISSRTWLVMREEFGLTGEHSGPVIAWVIQLMLDALRDPSAPRPGDAGSEGNAR